MALIPIEQAMGDQVRLARTDARHLASRLKPPEPGEDGTFTSLMQRALDGVNGLDAQSAELSQKMITNPDEVDVHDVTIAMAKANLAVSITKAVVDRAVRAYTDIINIR